MIEEATNRLKLLEILAGSEGQIVPSSTLTDALALSRQAAFKLIGALRGEGLDIESVPQKGYILNSIYQTQAMSPTLIDFLLRTNQLFSKCYYYPEVDSTQAVAKKFAWDNTPAGVVVTTDSQTEGRGRRGRSWISPAGKNLYFSILLRPNLKPGDVQLLNLAAGIAVRETLIQEYGVDAELKWPNDVLSGGKKICGILSEAAGDADKIYYAITGIGVNVNMSADDLSADLKKTATSMLIEKHCAISRPILLRDIFSRFSELMRVLENPDAGVEKLLSIYRQSCDTIGKEVRVIQDDEEFQGRALDVTGQGALIVEIDGKEKAFAAADVHHLRLK
ncbi:biotin--[acetyl-CoA-carboxylase] ligase [Synergistaceae bacterium OttesenSCG-928-D05]|nr:biotin--[acetyl-CoA-carboxylase] ligase [Synergistaceae bacterium OttesenSCG-928-D05]